MQHSPASPHRSTLWRRKKGLVQPRECPERRAFLIQWVGSIVQLLKQKGRCHFYEIKQYPTLKESLADPTLDNSVRYYLSDEFLRKALTESRFYGEMLATAAFEIGQLNYAKPDSKKQRASKRENSIKASLKKSGLSAVATSAALREFRKAPDAPWIREFIESPEKQEWRWAHGKKELYLVSMDETLGESPQTRPEKPRKATPVCAVAELEISRQMASYWRNHKDYPACIALLKELVGRPLPKAPNWEFGTYSRPALAKIYSQHSIPASEKST